MSKTLLPGLSPVTLPADRPNVEVGAPDFGELQDNIRFLRKRHVVPMDEALENPTIVEMLETVQAELQYRADTHRNPWAIGLEDFDVAVYSTGHGNQFPQFVNAGLSVAFVVKGQDASEDERAIVVADVAGRFGDVHDHTSTANGLVIAAAAFKPAVR